MFVLDRAFAVIEGHPSELGWTRSPGAPPAFQLHAVFLILSVPANTMNGGGTGVSRACSERSRRVQPGGDARLSTSTTTSERILQRELNQPRCADGLGDLANVGTLLHVGIPTVQRVLE